MENKFIDKALKYISNMMYHIKTSALKVEFISKYPQLVYSPNTCRAEYEFLKYYCTDDIAESGTGIDELVMCMENVHDGGLHLPENDESWSDCVDKVFTSFVRMFNASSEHMPELEGWTAEKIAQTMLEYMHDYYTIYWKSGKTAEEYFMSCLLTTVGMD